MSSRTHRSTAIPLALTGCAILCCVATGRAQQLPVCNDNVALATLFVTVVDRPTRAPLTGASVNASWPGSSGALARAVSDSVGKIVICVPVETPITLRTAYHALPITTETMTLSRARTANHVTALELPGIFVRGTVIDRETGMPLPNAAVRIAHTALSALTDSDGKFFFERLPHGDFQLRVDYLSYATAAAVLRARDEDLTVTVRLTPQAIALEPVIVTAFSRRLDRVGFYERERRGVGIFLGRRQIDAMNVQNASDLLRVVPSMRLIPQTARRNSPRNATIGRGNCRFKFIVDGSRTLADFEMDYVAAYAIEGVEVYNGLSEVPALFRAQATAEPGGAICGVIAIWTRNSS